MASKRHKKMHFIGTKGRHSVGSHWQGMQGSKPPSRFTQPLMYIISPCQVDVTMFNVQYPTTLLVTTNEPRTIPVLAKVHGPLELLNKGATNGYHMYVYIYIYIYTHISIESCGQNYFLLAMDMAKVGWSPLGCESFNTDLNIPSPLPTTLVFR